MVRPAPFSESSAPRGWVDKPQRQLQAYIGHWRQWCESLDTLWGVMELRKDLHNTWEVGKL